MSVIIIIGGGGKAAIDRAVALSARMTPEEVKAGQKIVDNLRKALYKLCDDVEKRS